MAQPDQEYLWRIFQSVDSDGSRYINAEELQQALSNGTWKPFNPETVRLMIGMFDRQNRGQIGFEDFGALWKYVIDWQNCFESFDRDKSGNINKSELQTALTSFGYQLSEGLLDTLVRKFDRYGNGTILFDDFIQACIVLHDHIQRHENKNEGQSEDPLSNKQKLAVLPRTDPTHIEQPAFEAQRLTI